MGAVMLWMWTSAGAWAEPGEAEHLDRERVAAFVDAFVDKAMAERHLPGALVMVIEGDATVFAKGYGLANVDTGLVWDPAEVTFQAGSISKVMTATAAVKLAESGKLDLQADVNRYLKGMRIPDTFARPVTMSDLLTHTGGFDERYVGMHARPKSALTPLGEYLAARMPRRVMPPGTVMSYNDHAFTLAGYVVECAAGMPFEAYCQRALFEPLGMRQTTFDAPESWLEHMAVGYKRAGGGFAPYPHDYLNVGPAAGLITTGNDIARFLKAMLNGGALDGTRVLTAESAAELTTTHFRHNDALPGMAYGWEEVRYRGQRLVQKPGGMPGINSNMYLIPDRNVALFITHNLEDSTNYDFLYAFLDEFFPGEAPTPAAPMAGAAERTARYTGSYRHTRYSHDTLAKLITLMDQVKVAAADDGRLRVFGHDYVEIAPGVFKTPDGEGTVAFRVPEGADRASFLFVGRGAYERVRWYEITAVQGGFVAAIVLVFLTAPLIALGVWWRRRKRNAPPAGRWAGAALALAAAAGVVNVAFLAGFAYVLTAMDQWQFLSGLPASVDALLILPKLTTLAAAAALGLCAAAWIRRWWSLPLRAYYTLLALALVAFVPFLLYWNLLVHPV